VSSSPTPGTPQDLARAVAATFPSDASRSLADAEARLASPVAATWPRLRALAASGIALGTSAAWVAAASGHLPWWVAAGGQALVVAVDVLLHVYFPDRPVGAAPAGAP
jgi:hypothetical protein